MRNLEIVLNERGSNKDQADIDKTKQIEKIQEIWSWNKDSN